MTGRKPRDVLGKFGVADDGKTVFSCPKGHAPRSSSYNKKTGNVRVSFDRSQCEGCPFYEECKAKIKVRTAFVTFSMNARKRLLWEPTEEEKEKLQLICRIRNGVETLPSMLRRLFRVDEMPVRGLLKTKHRFGFKLAALNCIKLFRFTNGKAGCCTLMA